MSDLFVTVPETTLPGGITVPAFLVGAYVCTHTADARAAVTAEGTPWVNINYHVARAACIEADFQLITETQALALAYQVAIQDENWTGGKVGDGKLYQGLRKWTAKSVQGGTFTPKDPDERRWFALPNGQRIFDVAGNVYTWVFDDVQGDEQGLVAKAFKADSPSLVIPYPAEAKGQGWTPSAGSDWSGRALLRGGCWYSEGVAGAFRLSRGWPDYRYGDVGFRCTKPIGL